MFEVERRFEEGVVGFFEAEVQFLVPGEALGDKVKGGRVTGC